MRSKSFKLLTKAFSLVGINTEDDNQRLWWHIIKKCAFLFGTITTILTTFYTAAVNPNSALSDRLFFGTVCTCYNFLLIQMILLWNQRDNFLSILEETSTIYDIFVKKDIFHRYSIEFYDAPTKTLDKMAKILITIFTSNMISFSLIPVMLSQVDSVFPIEFHVFGKNSAETFWFNHILQIINVEEYMKALYVSTFIFAFLSLNLIFDLKVIAKVCSTIGEYEESSESLTISQKGPRFINVVDKPVEKSRETLQTIIELHAHCIIIIEKINEISAFEILAWESTMILGNCMLYILILLDPRKSLMYSGSLTITIVLYYFASLMSSLIEDEFQNICLSLYQSKWYLLGIKERQMVVMIQMMAQKIKTVKVGVFGNASLDRYSIAVKTIYRFCLLIKVIIGDEIQQK